MGIIWTIIIGFIAGVIAKFIMPGPNEPQGFIMTTLLGIVGAFLATFLGQALGWYRADEGAGFIGAIASRQGRLRPPFFEALSPAAGMILVMVSAELTMMTSFTLRRVHRTGDAA